MSISRKLGTAAVIENARKPAEPPALTTREARGIYTKRRGIVAIKSVSATDASQAKRHGQRDPAGEPELLSASSTKPAGSAVRYHQMLHLAEPLQRRPPDKRMRPRDHHKILIIDGSRPQRVGARSIGATAISINPIQFGGTGVARSTERSSCGGSSCRNPMSMPGRGRAAPPATGRAPMTPRRGADDKAPRRCRRVERRGAPSTLPPAPADRRPVRPAPRRAVGTTPFGVRRKGSFPPPQRPSHGYCRRRRQIETARGPTCSLRMT